MLKQIKFYQLLINSKMIDQGFDPVYLRAYSKEELYEECFEHISDISGDEIPCIPCNTEERILTFDTDTLVKYQCKIEDKYRNSFYAITNNSKVKYYFDLSTLTWKHIDITNSNLF